MNGFQSLKRIFNSLTGKADKITGGTTDNLVKRDAGGNIADAGVAVSTDGTLASNSDAKVATEKAVKTYADTKLSGADGSVTNAKLADMATQTIKGRTTAGTGDPEDLTGAQVNALLPAATDTLKGLVKLLAAPGIAPADTAVRGDDLRLAQATTTQRGTSERATSAEVIAGTDDLAHVTSAGLAAWAANDSRLGTTGGARFMDGYTDANTGPLFPSGTTDFYFSAQVVFGPKASIKDDGEVITEQASGFLVYRFKSTGELRVSKSGGGWGPINMGVPTEGVPHFIEYLRVAGVGYAYLDGVQVGTAADTNNWPGSRSRIGTSVWSSSFSARAYMFLNRAPTAAERLAYSRGEYPAKDLGGTVSLLSGTNTWGDVTWTSSGGTIVTNSGGTLTVTAPSAINTAALSMHYGSPTTVGKPLAVIGRKVRVTVTLVVNSGTNPFLVLAAAGNIRSATVPLVPGTNTYELTVAVASTSDSENPTVYIGNSSGASDFTITQADMTVLGAQVLIGPADWCHTRARDISGNCNDLIYGKGVVPVSPVPFERPFEVTTAGATVTASTVATVGTLTGVSYRDKQAIAALRQWDGVKPSMGAARPANSTGLLGSATANGTLLIESGATAAGNAVFAASTKLKVLVTE